MFSSRTTRTYNYSSGGPGGNTVTTTRTYTDADGNVKTETTTNDGGSDAGGNFTSNFNQMKIGGGSDNSYSSSRPTSAGSSGTKRYVARSAPSGSRFIKGWGSRRQRAGPPMQLQGKSYQDIRSECKAKGELFEDPDFPAIDSSIFYSKKPPRPFIWKRPHELCDEPKLFVDGASRFDVKQGELGDCWLLAAVASLCGHKDLLYRVVPRDQSFEDDDYSGVFHFQFWQYGEWKDIIIDDRLPTYYDKLVFMHSVDNTEFWTPLLEKAYAKLCGSYEALKGGATSEAMEDFTGGCTETFDFRQNVPPNLFQIMLKAHTRNSLMGCSIEAADSGQMEAELSNGLIMGHAYSITNVKLIPGCYGRGEDASEVDIQTSRVRGKIPMVRIRNPWGNECEWNGPWSDKSQEWKFIPEDERKEIGLTFDDDGEFWMSFQDFSKNFQKLEVCNLGPDNIAAANDHKRWESTTVQGSWRRRVNAGGCRNFLETFWTNPQYRVEVTDYDEDDEDAGTLIVGLMQKNRRKLKMEGHDLLTIGYSVYKLKEDNSRPLDMRFFKYNASVARAPAFINLREVCGRHKLPPGTYCIMPTTFEPNQEGDFLLRLFSEKENRSSEIDEETSMSDMQDSKRSGNNRSDSRGIAGKGMVEEEDEGAPAPELTEEDVAQDKEMRMAFKKVAGEDMEIDAYELQDILNEAFMKEFKFDGFSAETCRSLVAMMDMDRSGKLGFEEFKKLWTDLRVWKSVFKQFDKDRSGKFSSHELRQAFHASGFSISNATFNALVQRYTHRDGGLYFDDYIHCFARMKTMFDIFREAAHGGKKAEFGIDEFIQTTMYS